MNGFLRKRNGSPFPPSIVVPSLLWIAVTISLRSHNHTGYMQALPFQSYNARAEEAFVFDSWLRDLVAVVYKSNFAGAHAWENMEASMRYSKPKNTESIKCLRVGCRDVVIFG